MLTRFYRSSDRHLRLAMALTRRAAVEDKIQYLATKYNIDEDDVRKLFAMDPTKGQYLEWLVLRDDRGEFPTLNLKSIAPRIRRVLEIFTEIKNSPKVLEQLGASKDINKYTFHTLEGLASRALELGDLRSERQKQKGAKASGSRTIYDDRHIKIIQIGGPDTDLDQASTAACIYAWGTKWCTSRPGVAREYLERDPLYIIFRDGQKIAQFFMSGVSGLVEIMGATNEEFRLEENLDVLEALKNSGISLNDDLWIDIIAYSRIKLNSQDLEHIKSSPRLCFIYARSRVRGPWPEGEPTILRDPYYSLSYVNQVLKRRWPEFERELISFIKDSKSFRPILMEVAHRYENEFFPNSWWPELY